MPELENTIRVSIVVPVVNESAGLADLLSDLRSVLRGGVEVLIVDNGSTDGTWETLQEQQDIVVVREPRPGFGSAVKTGLLHAQGDVVAWMPGNLRVRAADALALAELVRGATTPSFAKAWRVGRPRRDTLTSGVAGLLLSALGRADLRDFGGTPTAVPRSAVTSLISGPDDLAFEPYALWKLPRSGFSPVRPRVRFGERRHGKSRWNSGVASQVKLLLHLGRSVPRFSSEK